VTRIKSNCRCPSSPELRLPKEVSRLDLMAVDYVPNRWFSTRTKSARRHVATWGPIFSPFERSRRLAWTPKGILRSTGQPSMRKLSDWPWARKILFHLNHPPVRVRREENRRGEAGPSNSNTSARCAIICARVAGLRGIMLLPCSMNRASIMVSERSPSLGSTFAGTVVAKPDPQSALPIPGSPVPRDLQMKAL